MDRGAARQALQAGDFRSSCLGYLRAIEHQPKLAEVITTRTQKISLPPPSSQVFHLYSSSYFFDFPFSLFFNTSTSPH